MENSPGYIPSANICFLELFWGFILMSSNVWHCCYWGLDISSRPDGHIAFHIRGYRRVLNFRFAQKLRWWCYRQSIRCAYVYAWCYAALHWSHSFLGFWHFSSHLACLGLHLSGMRTGGVSVEAFDAVSGKIKCNSGELRSSPHAYWSFLLLHASAEEVSTYILQAYIR